MIIKLLSKPGFIGQASLFLLGLLVHPVLQAAPSKVKISQAAWYPKTHTLKIKGQNGSSVPTAEIYDINGRRLTSSSGKRLNLSLSDDQFPSVPCAVRVQAGNDEATKPVKGAPKACLRAPTCKITAPRDGVALAVEQNTDFKAEVVAKDKKAQSLKYEWDFSGGVMGELIPGSSPPAYKRPEGKSTTVQFVRNHNQYRVRFSATDSKGRRCEDSIEVAVGTPPEAPPGVAAMAAASVASAPKLGSELDGKADDLVVMPFEDWTMQNFTDMRVTPNGYVSFIHTVNNLNAYIFRKARLPVLLGPDAVDLRYSAAANPSNPVGLNAINSTSQNWPLNADIVYPAPLMTSTIQKSDQWEQYQRTGSENLAYFYVSQTWNEIFQDPWMAKVPGLPRVDEGNFPHDDPQRAADMERTNPDTAPEDLEKTAQDTYDSYNNSLTNKKKRLAEGVTHGTYMPGVLNPFVVNDPQLFPASVEFSHDADNNTTTPQPISDRFVASLLPVTDITDQGRVDPFPLFRFEAVNKGSSDVVSTTDGVLSNSRDFHCRECHAKGKIGANPNAGYKAAAFRSSPYGKNTLTDEHRNLEHDPDLERPEFFDALSNNLYDQEYAAALNYSSMHQFYDGMGFLDLMRYGSVDHENNLINYDYSAPCVGCHMSPLRSVITGDIWNTTEDRDPTNPGYDPDYSTSMHRFHGEMQYNDDKSDIVRDENGAYKRFDWKSLTARTPNADPNPRTLFPIFRDGQQLPMEENCLKCHAGHREQLYRDRMYTAGMTCFDCHGDMLAMGRAFTKDKAKANSLLRSDYRVPWFDETDCGSCHTGNANVGKNGSGGYFSAAVRKRAFDDTDLSAKTRAVDKSDQNAARFAVLPNHVEDFATIYSYRNPMLPDPAEGFTNVTDESPTHIDLPVYRKGKDTHGNVACAVCHGAAHAVWPNRDPSANDNVTALQLQGHTGTLLECNVCHTADSFAKLEDLDGGVYSGDTVPGILGGPHNTHPIADTNWWKQAAGDTANADGTTYGGWHNDYAKKPGRDGKDQCAACHGDDHLGTRLSKTPVDRVFDFSGFDMKKLKKAGLKKQVVKVGAGSEIGCDTCHSVEISFTDSPGKS